MAQPHRKKLARLPMGQSEPTATGTLI